MGTMSDSGYTSPSSKSSTASCLGVSPKPVVAGLPTACVPLREAGVALQSVGLPAVLKGVSRVPAVAVALGLARAGLPEAPVVVCAGLLLLIGYTSPSSKSSTASCRGVLSPRPVVAGLPSVCVLLRGAGVALQSNGLPVVLVGVSRGLPEAPAAAIALGLARAGLLILIGKFSPSPTSPAGRGSTTVGPVAAGTLSVYCVPCSRPSSVGTSSMSIGRSWSNRLS